MHWQLDFDWFPLSNEKINYLQPYEPIKMPVMSGGLLAISIKFLRILGKYDEKLNICGGENVELSLKAWLCGGSIHQYPCSHVGHIFRTDGFPYDFGEENAGRVVDLNKKRVAEVWIDEYIE